MKKHLLLIAALALSVASFAGQKELFDIAQVTTESWSAGSGDPVVTVDQQAGEITIAITGQQYPGQWNNGVKITLTNVATQGLDLNKKYRLKFAYRTSSNDCGGVTFKMFDDQELKYENQSMQFVQMDQFYDTGELTPTAAATTAKLVFDFGWDPTQTITLSQISLMEIDDDPSSAIEAQASGQSIYKTFENGQLVIVTPKGKFNLLGEIVK